eukprot:7848935-Alexandrium_andersonii.AAC.1
MTGILDVSFANDLLKLLHVVCAESVDATNPVSVSVVEKSRSELLSNKLSAWHKPLTLFATGMLVGKRASELMLRLRRDEMQCVALEQLKSTSA